MKRSGLFIAFITLLAASLFSIVVSAPAQRVSSNSVGTNITAADAGTCSTTGTFLWQQLPTNASTTTVNLSGVFVATITVRLSNNGGGSWSTNQTLTTTGTVTVVTNGFTDICADVTAYTSGNVGVSLSTGVGVGVPALPGGTNGQVQYNNNSAFGGATGFTYSPAGATTVTLASQASGGTALALSQGGGGAGTTLTISAAAGRLVNLGANVFVDSSGNFNLANAANITGAAQISPGGSISLTGTGACLTITGPTGGAWNGGGTCTGTTGASTLIITPGTTAAHFWNCWGSDTTAKVAGAQSGVNATTCTLNFASVTANDVVTITAMPF